MNELLIFLIKIRRKFGLHYQKKKSGENLMFMFANSGWNKLNVREKEKDGLQFILGKIIKEYCVNINHVHVQQNVTIFIKNNVCILKQFVIVTARKSFFFFLGLQKKKHILVSWFSGWVGWRNSIVKNENYVAFPKSRCVNSYPGQAT